MNCRSVSGRYTNKAEGSPECTPQREAKARHRKQPPLARVACATSYLIAQEHDEE